MLQKAQPRVPTSTTKDAPLPDILIARLPEKIRRIDSAGSDELERVLSRWSGDLLEYLRLKKLPAPAEVVEASPEADALALGAWGVTPLPINLVLPLTIPYGKTISPIPQVHCTILNEVDAAPFAMTMVVRARTTTSFTIEFGGEPDTANYYLMWEARPPL